MLTAHSPMRRAIHTSLHEHRDQGKMSRQNLLITTDLLEQASIRKLSRKAKVFLASSVDQNKLSALLPSIDSLMIFSWPKFLDKHTIRKMPRLRFIQSILAGVNHVPFEMLGRNVIVASNAGAYSRPVAEYAWGLLLSAAKKIVDHHTALRDGRAVLVRHGDAARGIYVLNHKTLGILGYGGIGTLVGEMANPFQMKVIAWSRRKTRASDVTLVRGKRGFERVLKESDAIVMTLPLTRATTRIINKDSLALMKEQTVLVNVARGELVNEEALYNHLKTHPDFRYATDVWWYREGRESLDTARDFKSLANFIGTPHVSGPSGLATGEPIKIAVENTLRFLRGVPPKNVVDRSDYTG
jgi:phosphoglycerate dehydrogenase-like enzyme